MRNLRNLRPAIALGFALLASCIAFTTTSIAAPPDAHTFMAYQAIASEIEPGFMIVTAEVLDIQTLKATDTISMAVESRSMSDTLAKDTHKLEIFPLGNPAESNGGAISRAPPRTL